MEIFSQDVKNEQDILAARDRTRVICEEMGFPVPQQLQVLTSVFELGKNILEHGGKGKIRVLLLTSDDTIAVQVEGTDSGEGMDEGTIRGLLSSKTSSTALRGIPAMKRLMDSIEIESEPGHGTTVRMLKRRSDSSKSITKNIVGFFQEKFSSRKKPSLSDEIQLQNTNLAQTLSLYEEKNQELEQSNKELLELKKQLEESNKELKDRSSELQDALLSLGDRTAELEEKNRRFSVLLHEIREGVVITDRSNEIVDINDGFCRIFGIQPDELMSKKMIDWKDFLCQHKFCDDQEWVELFNTIEQKKNTPFAFDVFAMASEQKLQCRSVPIMSEKRKFYGRLWIFTEKL